jgi:hypothetical protein
MICSDARELISPFLDGELLQDEANLLEEHLQECPLCKQEFNASKQLVAALRELGKRELSAPAGFSNAVMSRLPNEKTATGIIGWKRLGQLAGGIAAAVLLTAVVKFSGQMPVNQIAQLQPQQQSGSGQTDLSASNPTPTNIQNTSENEKASSPVDSSSSADNAGTQEPSENQNPSSSSSEIYSAQLTGNRDCVIVSTFLKINVAGSQKAEDAAGQLVSDYGASMRSLGQQTSSDGKLCLVNSITVDSSQAQELIDSLAGLGSVVSRQEQKADLTEQYSQLSAQLITLKNQRSQTQEPVQIEQLNKQISQAEKQLRSWVEQSSSQTIVLWLHQQ